MKNKFSITSQVAICLLCLFLFSECDCTIRTHDTSNMTITPLDLKALDFEMPVAYLDSHRGENRYICCNRE